MRASRLVRATSVVLITAATLTLPHCHSWLPVGASQAELSGTWEAEEYNAELTLRDDWTFELANVPLGYVNTFAVNFAEPNTSSQVRVTLTGTWEFDGAGMEDGGQVEYGRGMTLMPDQDVGVTWVPLHIGGHLWGGLDHLYLIQGDPDTGDYLIFFREGAED